MEAYKDIQFKLRNQYELLLYDNLYAVNSLWQQF